MLGVVTWRLSFENAMFQFSQGVKLNAPNLKFCSHMAIGRCAEPRPQVVSRFRRAVDDERGSCLDCEAA